MTCAIGCNGKLMSAQAYLKATQKESIQPPAAQSPVKAEPFKAEALNAGGDRGTVLNVSA